MSSLLKRLLKYLLYGISAAFVLATGLIAYLIWFQPPFYFPKPTGQYAVGVKTYHWIDISRKETLADDPAHPNRELMVKAWYPSSPRGFDGTGPIDDSLTNKPTTQYAPDLIDYLKKNQKLRWLLGCSRPIYSYAQHNAPVIAGTSPLPVIIFSHGRGACNNASNTAQCEQLASHGYVVFAINHTYSSIFAKFPDGRIIDGMKAIAQRRTGSNFTQLKKQFDQELEVWVADVQFVLDQLEQLTNNKESMFYKRFDQNNIGMFGHSLGGATAVQICRRDSRVKAGIDLDGALFGFDAIKPFDKPFMFMLNEGMVKMVEKPLSKNLCNDPDFKITSPDEEKIFKSICFFSIVQLAQSLGHDAYTFVIKDFEHLDFTDIALLKQASLFLRLIGNIGQLSGPINGFRATEIVNAYLVNFFDKYLKGKASELLDGGSKRYTEVKSI